MEKSFSCISLCMFICSIGFCGTNDRWKIQTDGSILWCVSRDIPHYDHVEMSGEHVSAVLRYGVNSDGSSSIEHSVVWPMLRTIPNNTHASLNRRFVIDLLSQLVVNDASLDKERVKSFKLDGGLTVVSEFAITDANSLVGAENRSLAEVTRKIFPSINKPMLCENYSLKNISDTPIRVTIPWYRRIYQTNPDNGVNGSYTIVIGADFSGTLVLAPNEKIEFNTSIQAFSKEKGEKEIIPDINEELALREDFVTEMWQNLALETPDPVINSEFAFAKIRASESIYRTAGGLMHGPGGESYYAAIWANDESEYVAPFFPFLGYKTGNEATLNTFRLYMKYMNPEYNPLPSSIIAEGLDTWQGAGDCGDAAMLAYGGIRYALTRGDIDEAEYIWPLMEWSLEYCNRQLNSDGVVKSDSDELEGRFPSGEANILVSSLYYDALVSAVFLGNELGLPASQISNYKNQSLQLKESIEKYFGANVEGYDVYAYYKGNDLLRSWICAPLFAGINDRAEATIDALFSKLWTENGLLSQTGSDNYWDRSTLSALRAAYVVGETEKATQYLKEYSSKRLLGNHVPYPIEAWPEGNQRHLSGESALYCRIITEGMFGIRPTGFQTFTLTPKLPDSWNSMALRNIKAFSSEFDILVERTNENIRVSLKTEAKIIKQVSITNGETITIDISDITDGISNVDFGFQIYPNPATDKLSIVFPNGVTSHSSLSIYSSNGRQLWSKKLAIATITESIDLSFIKSEGLYIIELMDSEKSIREKFIVQ